MHFFACLVLASGRVGRWLVCNSSVSVCHTNVKRARSHSPARWAADAVFVGLGHHRNGVLVGIPEWRMRSQIPPTRGGCHSRAFTPPAFEIGTTLRADKSTVPSDTNDVFLLRRRWSAAFGSGIDEDAARIARLIGDGAPCGISRAFTGLDEQLVFHARIGARWLALTMPIEAIARVPPG